MNKLIINSFNEPILIEYEAEPVKVEIMSLLYKKKTVDLSETSVKQEMVPYEVAWIRIFDASNVAYNILAKNVLIIVNEAGALIQINAEYELITVRNIIDQLRVLSLKGTNDLDFEKDSVFDDYTKYIENKILILQKRRDIFIKNSSTNSDIKELNEWINKRDEIIYDLTKVEIMKKLSIDNKTEIEEVINEKRLSFV